MTLYIEEKLLTVGSYAKPQNPRTEQTGVKWGLMPLALALVGVILASGVVVSHPLHPKPEEQSRHGGLYLLPHFENEKTESE